MVQELAWAEWQVDYMEGFSFSFPFHVECFAVCGACSVSQPVGTLSFYTAFLFPCCHFLTSVLSKGIKPSPHLTLVRVKK